MHSIVSEYVTFVHVFYDNSVHGTCIDLRSIRSIAYSQSHGYAHNRYTPSYLERDTPTFLDSVSRARDTCAYSTPLHAPNPRAKPSDSDSYPSHRRGHSRDSTPSSRENSRGHPLAIIHAKCIIFVFRYRGTHVKFWLISETCISTDFSCENVVAKHSRVYARDTDTCMYREAFTMSRKNVALLQNSRKKLVIVRLDSERWRAVQCSPQCTRPSSFVTVIVQCSVSCMCEQLYRASCAWLYVCFARRVLTQDFAYEVSFACMCGQLYRASYKYFVRVYVREMSRTVLVGVRA